MPSIKAIGGADISTLFKARTGTARANVGIKDGAGVDIATLYEASTGGDQVASATGIRWNDSGTIRDLQELFRDIDYVAAPVITTHPTSQTIDSGDSVTFTVVASGDPTLTYQWKKDGVDIGGATSASYTRNNLTNSDEGSYTCVVTNDSGSATSNAAVLTVNAAPVITAHPFSGTANSGGNFSFSVTATGDATLTYQWRKGGVDIGGATSSTLILYGVTDASEGNYDCVVTNGFGSATSNSASLTVYTAPSITSHPTGGTLYAGNVASFSVSATGDATLTYQWRKDGSNIGGATGSTYSFTTDHTNDSGTYDCVVSNAYGSATSNGASLTVLSTLSITGHPSGATLNAGDVASFSVTASGTGLSYQWRKDGSNIGGATGSTYSFTTTGPGDSGSYDCVVTSTDGDSLDSNDATLTVNDVAPTITGGTVTGGPYSFGVGAGCNFTVTATGTNLEYAWYKDDVETGHYSAQGPSFTATEDDIGTHNYKVAVWNSANPAGVYADTDLTIS